MNTTPTPCYCCNEPVTREVGKHPLVATFEGQLMEVCKDCATGIQNGLKSFRNHGVVGEYLGPCGDNGTP